MNKTWVYARIAEESSALSKAERKEGAASAASLITDHVLLAVRDLQYLRLREIPAGSHWGCTCWQENIRWHPADSASCGYWRSPALSRSWQGGQSLCFGDTRTRDVLLLGVKNWKVSLKVHHFAHSGVICLGSSLKKTSRTLVRVGTQQSHWHV